MQYHGVMTHHLLYMAIPCHSIESVVGSRTVKGPPRIEYTCMHENWENVVVENHHNNSMAMWHFDISQSG